MMDWGEKIFHHRSLVQHVGARSVGNPGARLVGARAPAADFDPRLDALTLVGAGASAIVAPDGPQCDWPGRCGLRARPGGTRCDQHEIRRRRPRQIGTAVR